MRESEKSAPLTAISKIVLEATGKVTFGLMQTTDEDDSQKPSTKKTGPFMTPEPSKLPPIQRHLGEGANGYPMGNEGGKFWRKFLPVMVMTEPPDDGASWTDKNDGVA